MTRKITIIDSILAINPNAEITMEENNIDSINWLNDTPVISNEDILAKQSELQTVEDNKPNAQASGNQKLLDLGLSQAEATALTGYTPPVAE
jgi:hypothetical protein